MQLLADSPRCRSPSSCRHCGRAKNCSPPLRSTKSRQACVISLFSTITPRRGQQRSRTIDRRAGRRQPKLVVAVDVAHRPVVDVEARERLRVREVHELRRCRDECVAMRVRLHVDQAGLDARAHFRPRHEQIVLGLRRRRHPIRRHEQNRAGFERAQQRQRDRPETLARIVESEQHGARQPPAAVTRRQVLFQRQRAIAVAVQEFEIAREYLRLHVVIREDRNFAARHRQAEDEAGVAGS